MYFLLSFCFNREDAVLQWTLQAHQTLNQAHQDGLTDLLYVEMMHGIEKGSGKRGKGLLCFPFYTYPLF